MGRKFLVLATIGLLATVLTIPPRFESSSVGAATPDQIETAVVKGLKWLAKQQNVTDGHFESPTGSLGRHAGATCLALIKFEHRGWELYPPPRKGPFDPNYQYKANVKKGLEYAFKQMVVEGNFVYVKVLNLPGSPDRVYETGICMMAVAASRTPDGLNGTVPSTLGSPVDGWTYRAVLEGMLLWMQHAQKAATESWAACHVGGWGYVANDPINSDNSNSGYASLGIGFAMSPAYGFGLPVSVDVRNDLKTFVKNVQDDSVSGSGCSYYTSCYAQHWRNMLKTGHLLYEMNLAGMPHTAPEVQKAIGCIQGLWNNSVGDGQPELGGWQGDYHAMFAMMNGLGAYGITDLGGTIGDWFARVSDYIINNRIVDSGTGGWYWDSPPTSIAPFLGGDDLVLQTSWALLTLEKAVPTPPLPEVNYKCYEIEGDTAGAIVTLETQFGLEHEVVVGKATLLCAPALKDDHGNLDLAHLKCYDILPGHDPPDVVQLETQFGLEPYVPVGQAKRLCVPATKQVVQPPPQPTPEPPPPGPNYKCYEISGPGVLTGVNVETQFGPQEEMVLDPVLLCTNALKDGEGYVGIPDLKCYHLGEPIPPSPPVAVNLLTQFGLEENVGVGLGTLLCVATNKTAAPGVGGVVEVRDGAAPLSADQGGPSAPPYAAIAGAAAAAVVAIAAGAWYARRRWLG